MDFEKYGVKTPEDLMNYFKANMKYGFVFKNKVFTEDNSNFQNNMDKYYKLRLKEDFLKNKYGVCWDFCECEREFFEFANIEHRCFFIESFLKGENGGPTHTFALFKKGKKWFWFEYSWEIYRGIHEYASVENALKDILKKYKTFYNRNLLDVKIYEYPKLKKRVDTFEFVEHCTKSKNILL